MRVLDFALQQLFADLNQRVHDAEFDRDFPANGSFRRRTIKGRDYWYYDGYDPLSGSKLSRYVGADDNDETHRRIENFRQIKSAQRDRADLVDALVGVGFPSIDYFTGRIVDEMSKAGFFRLRGVLVGTIAFGAYPGLVGALPARGHLHTGDVDFAQDHGISVAIGESMAPVIDTLRKVDKSFKPAPSLLSQALSSKFINDKGYKVEFLVPNRGSEDNASHLTIMPAPGGAAAQPLRFLDFLIKDPIRSTLMHEGGVGVFVPHPARYGIHKLIVAIERQDEEKARKDLGQATFLIEALSRSGPHRLANAWADAWKRGLSWRRHLTTALPLLAETVRTQLRQAVVERAAELELDEEAVAAL